MSRTIVTRGVKGFGVVDGEISGEFQNGNLHVSFRKTHSSLPAETKTEVVNTEEVSMTTQASFDKPAKEDVLEERLHDFGWGLLLVVIGAILLLPSERVPHGSWLIAAGVILLGLNAARAFHGFRTSGFSLVVGTLALIAGLGEFFEIHVPLFAVGLIVIGLYEFVKWLRHESSSATSATGGSSCCGNICR